MTPGRPLIAIYGSSRVREGEPAYVRALALGAELARAGAVVMNGGYGGVMEASSRGAAEAGGHVLGVTVETYAGRGGPNPWVTERRHAPDLFERLKLLVLGADGFVAVGGSLGTLAEVFVVWTLLAAAARPPAPLILLGEEWHAVLEAHREAGFLEPESFRLVTIALDPVEAARLVLDGSAASART